MAANQTGRLCLAAKNPDVRLYIPPISEVALGMGTALVLTEMQGPARVENSSRSGLPRELMVGLRLSRKGK